MGNDSVSFEAIRVFLLIENRLLREALVHIFRKSSPITVVGQSWRTDWTAQDILDSDSDILVISPFQASWLPVGPALEKLGQLGVNMKTVQSRAARLERIRQRSRERYARPRRVVEAEVEQLMAPAPPYFQEDCDEA